MMEVISVIYFHSNPALTKMPEKNPKKYAILTLFLPNFLVA